MSDQIKARQRDRIKLFSDSAVCIMRTELNNINEKIRKDKHKSEFPTWRMTMAFSMERSSDGRPWLFQINCSLSNDRNDLKSNSIPTNINEDCYEFWLAEYYSWSKDSRLLMCHECSSGAPQKIADWLYWSHKYNFRSWYVPFFMFYSYINFLVN